jgi:DNA-binding GntR family transcriptional regulator
MTQPLRPGTAQTRSDVIAESVRAEILSGIRRPGERIRQELLAEEHGTSRLPVREALRILESDGLVTLVSHTGAWVTKMDMAECVEVYRIREQLDPLLVSLAVPHYTDDEVERLAELERTVAKSTSVEEFLEADRNFHVESYKAAQSIVLFDTVERFWNTTGQYRRAYSHLIGDAGLAINHLEHQLMITAFRDRDASEARRVLRGHIRRTRRALTRHPEIFESPMHAAGSDR